MAQQLHDDWAALAARSRPQLRSGGGGTNCSRRVCVHSLPCLATSIAVRVRGSRFECGPPRHCMRALSRPSSESESRSEPSSSSDSNLNPNPNSAANPERESAQQPIMALAKAQCGEREGNGSGSGVGHKRLRPPTAEAGGRRLRLRAPLRQYAEVWVLPDHSLSYNARKPSTKLAPHSSGLAAHGSQQAARWSLDGSGVGYAPPLARLARTERSEREIERSPTSAAMIRSGRCRASCASRSCDGCDSI